MPPWPRTGRSGTHTQPLASSLQHSFLRTAAQLSVRVIGRGTSAGERQARPTGSGQRGHAHLDMADSKLVAESRRPESKSACLRASCVPASLVRTRSQAHSCSLITAPLCYLRLTHTHTHIHTHTGCMYGKSCAVRAIRLCV